MRLFAVLLLILSASLLMACSTSTTSISQTNDSYVLPSVQIELVSTAPNLFTHPEYNTIMYGDVEAMVLQRIVVVNTELLANPDVVAINVNFPDNASVIVYKKEVVSCEDKYPLLVDDGFCETIDYFWEGVIPTNVENTQFYYVLFTVLSDGRASISGFDGYILQSSDSNTTHYSYELLNPKDANFSIITVRDKRLMEFLPD